MRALRSRFAPFLLAAPLALAANAASAQYVWTDERGVKQFSDRPPPASVPAKSILKQPGAAGATTEVPAARPSAQAPAAPTLAEREADFRKRALEKAEREQKAAGQARTQQARQKACDGARANQAALASGARLQSKAAKGERRVMDDAERARESAAARRVLAQCG